MIGLIEWLVAKTAVHLNAKVAMERAKPQATTTLVSQAGKNVSRKTREPAQLEAFFLF